MSRLSYEPEWDGLSRSGRAITVLAYYLDVLFLRIDLLFWPRGLLTFRELRELFGGSYPLELLTLDIPKTASRDEVIQALRGIANRNAQGRIFAEGAAQLGIKLAP